MHVPIFPYCFLSERVVKSLEGVLKREAGMEEQIPKLREDIEIIPTFHKKQRAIIVRDSLGLIKEPLLLYGEVLSFIALIDGKRNIRDIQLDLIRERNGVFVTSEEVEKILSELDSIFLLDSERYRQEKKRIISSYSLLKLRTAFHAGRSYPKEPEKLRALLDSFFSNEEELRLPEKGKEVAALIAPHIDLEIAKKVYAKAYQTIKNSNPERVILLGTGHNIYGSFLSLTEKEFETPFGRVRTDKDWVRKLRRAGGKMVADDDLAHQSEHSLEFQLIFLQHLFESEFFLIPILCGAFDKILEKVSRPREVPEIKKFLEELQICFEELDSGSLIVAGVDFSHIGPKFGHNQKASSMLLEAKNHDKLLIDSICNGDIEGFWSELKRVHNTYNVCGLSPLACLLEIQPGAKGSLLAYDFWQEDSTQSAVSFAAVAIERKEHF